MESTNPKQVVLPWSLVAVATRRPGSPHLRRRREAVPGRGQRAEAAAGGGHGVRGRGGLPGSLPEVDVMSPRINKRLVDPLFSGDSSLLEGIPPKNGTGLLIRGQHYSGRRF